MLFTEISVHRDSHAKRISTLCGEKAEIFNPLNAELKLIRHLLALVGARHFVHVSRIRANVNVLLYSSVAKKQRFLTL